MKYGVHQTMISASKMQAIDGMSGVISGKAKAAAGARDGEVEKLHAMIGQHKEWPPLLRGLDIIGPNHVLCAGITYIPMCRGFLYLVTVMDWASRRVLAWRLSNTMDVDFCIAAVEEAMTRRGRPEIFNTDQGSQFTGPRFTEVLTDIGVRISIDGGGGWTTSSSSGYRGR